MSQLVLPTAFESSARRGDISLSSGALCSAKFPLASYQGLLRRLHKWIAITVLDIGGVDHGADQQYTGIGNDMALASLDQLGRIKAPDTTAFRGLYGLAVDDASRRAGLASRRFTRGHEKVMVESAQRSVGTPSIEVTLDRAARRELLRQHPPLATRARIEIVRAIRRAGGEPRAMRDIVKACRRPRRFAHATGGGFPNALRPGLSGGPMLVDGARGLRCPASPRHALLAENPNLEAWGKPSLWVITKDLWY